MSGRDDLPMSLGSSWLQIPAICASPLVTVPYLEVLRGLAQTVQRYHQLLGEAQSEILVCNKAPYAGCEIQPEVLAALERKIPTRALYQREEMEDPAFEQLWSSLDAYHAAGVEGRVVETLPIPLAVFDRTHVLLVMEDPERPVPGEPTSLHVEHPGFGAAMAQLFEYHWQQGIAHTH